MTDCNATRLWKQAILSLGLRYSVVFRTKLWLPRVYLGSRLTAKSQDCGDKRLDLVAHCLSGAIHSDGTMAITRVWMKTDGKVPRLRLQTSKLAATCFPRESLNEKIACAVYEDKLQLPQVL